MPSWDFRGIIKMSLSLECLIYLFLYSSVFPSTNLPKAKKARIQTYTLKVTFASLEEGKIKNPTRQLYIVINDETANVDYIQQQCEESLNKGGIVLATSNGLLIEDSAATRGLCYIFSNRYHIDTHTYTHLYMSGQFYRKF